ncbi:MAG: SlyX family protein [Pseudomonadota bacterium]
MPDRLIALEETAAHHGAALEDLSAIVHRQAKQIDVLERRVALLMRRAAEAEAAARSAPAITESKPPHY